VAFVRNYAKERKYDSQPHVKQKRSNRTSARNKLMKAGFVRKGDGRDVHHVGGNALNKNSPLKVMSASKNRSFPRTRNARKVYKTS
tara:strand:+ start:210 stop:467 length:258 start_codon:yes stop_codon:yes gene_type:complete